MPEADLSSQQSTEIGAHRLIKSAHSRVNRAKIAVSDFAEQKTSPIIQRTRDFRDEIKNPDIDTGTFAQSTHEQDREIVQELEEITPELIRNPEKTKEVLDGMDADTLLMRQVIESRRGIRGILSRLDEKASIKGVRLSKVIGTIVAGSALSTGLKTGLHATNPLAGGIVGGALGGFWGYVRGRNKVESVGRWSTDVNIIGRESREDIEAMSPAELEMAIGVINNAVHGKKVRGGTEELLSLMRTYRTMKEVAADRTKETLEKYPLDEISKKLTAEEDVGRTITAGAREKYQDLYKDIIEGKRKQIWGSALKGAVVGATVGSLAGWAASKLSGATPGGHDQALQSQEQALRTEHLQHQGIVDQYNQPVSYPPEQYQVFNEHLTMIQHANNLAMNPGAHPAGFTPEGLTHFDTLLRGNTSIHDLVREAGLNNIDLTAQVGNTGQTLGNFVATNKEAFLHLPQEVQREMLSFPSLADQIFAGAITGVQTASAEIATAVVGGVGLGALGFHLGKKGREEAKSSYIAAKETDNREYSTREESLKTEAQRIEDEKKAAAEQKKTDQAKARDAKKAEKAAEKERNIEAAKQKLIGSEVIFKGFDIGVTKDRTFRIKDIDNEGRLEFYATDEDVQKMAKGDRVFPSVTIHTLLNPSGNLSSMIQVVNRLSERSRQPSGRTEIDTIKELEISGDYIDAQLKVVKIRNKQSGRDENKGKVVINGNEFFLDPKSETLFKAAGLKNGDKCQFRIVNHEDLRREPGRVFNISVELKPKEEPKPAPTPPEPQPTPEPTPAPAPTESVFRLKDFTSRDVVGEDDIMEIASYVENYADTASTANPSERVVIESEDGRFYQVNMFKDGAYQCQRIDAKTAKLVIGDYLSITEDELTDDGYIWYLENK